MEVTPTPLVALFEGRWAGASLHARGSPSAPAGLPGDARPCCDPGESSLPGSQRTQTERVTPDTAGAWSWATAASIRHGALVPVLTVDTFSFAIVTR